MPWHADRARTVVMKIADRVYLFDNSADGVDAALCARTEDGQLRKITASTAFSWSITWM